MPMPTHMRMPWMRTIVRRRSQQAPRLRSWRAMLVPAALMVAAAIPVGAWKLGPWRASTPTAPAARPQPAAPPVNPGEARRRADFAAMQTFRPGYAFWQHVFTIPDGRIAFGSAVDGRLLAIFPAKGDWTRQAVWADPTLAHILEGQR